MFVATYTITFAPAASGWKRPLCTPRTHYIDVVENNVEQLDMTPEEALTLLRTVHLPGSRECG